MTQPAPYPTTTTVGSAQLAVAAAHAEFKRVARLLASEGADVEMTDPALGLLQAAGWLESANVMRAAGQKATAGRRYARAVRSALEALAQTVGTEHESYKVVAALKERPRTVHNEANMMVLSPADWDLLRDFLKRRGALGGMGK